MSIYGVWFSGRNTPTVVSAESKSSAISKAKKRKTAGKSAGVKAAKVLNEKDAKLARAGKWVRTRASGASPNSSQGAKAVSKYRKGPAKKAKAKKKK